MYVYIYIYAILYNDISYNILWSQAPALPDRRGDQPGKLRRPEKLILLLLLINIRRLFVFFFFLIGVIIGGITIITVTVTTHMIPSLPVAAIFPRSRLEPVQFQVVV